MLLCKDNHIFFSNYYKTVVLQIYLNVCGTTIGKKMNNQANGVVILVTCLLHSILSLDFIILLLCKNEYKTNDLHLHLLITRDICRRGHSLSTSVVVDGSVNIRRATSLLSYRLSPSLSVQSYFALGEINAVYILDT